VATDQELDFADQVGRFFARQYGVPPATGRVAGWLLLCDPPAQTAAEIADALQMSRSAVGAAVGTLEPQGILRRTRAAGERADRIMVHPSYGVQSIESAGEYEALAAIARRGLQVIADAPVERRARLIAMTALADFLVERMPRLADEWREHLKTLRDAGELP
jgi:DNA-binding MarR family transcriptional regulator